MYKVLVFYKNASTTVDEIFDGVSSYSIESLFIKLYYDNDTMHIITFDAIKKITIIKL